jgi:hypothetical protein
MKIWIIIIGIVSFLVTSLAGGFLMFISGDLGDTKGMLISAFIILWGVFVCWALFSGIRSNSRPKLIIGVIMGVLPILIILRPIIGRLFN